MYGAADSLDRRRMVGDDVTILRAYSWRPPVGWWWPRCRDRIPRATTPEEREGERASEEQVERRVKARTRIAGARLWPEIAGPREPPDWIMLARSQGHQTYATVLWGKDFSEAERPIYCVFCNAIKSPRCPEPHTVPPLGEARLLMNTQGILDDMIAYYDPSSPNRPVWWRPNALNTRLVERVKGAFCFELGGKESFDMLFMNHGGTVLSPFFAVGIGSEWMVRVEAAKLALTAAATKS